MDNRIFRFEYCDKEFYPYIDEVLNKVPPDVKEKILDDPGFEILGIQDFLISNGMFLSLEKPVNSIVYLNSNMLKNRKKIQHTIVHEFAHYIARKGGTGLWEKEAEELLIRWGFIKESKEAMYNRPILEEKGYKIGYEWAENNETKLEILETFYYEWSNDELSEDRHVELIQEADIDSVINEMSERPQTEFEDIRDFPINRSLETGIIAGIMNYVGGKIKKWELYDSLQNKQGADIINLLEKISNYFERLYSIDLFTDRYFEVAHNLDIPDLSIKIDTLLDRVKAEISKNEN